MCQMPRVRLVPSSKSLNGCVGRCHVHQQLLATVSNLRLMMKYQLKHKRLLREGRLLVCNIVFFLFLHFAAIVLTCSKEKITLLPDDAYLGHVQIPSHLIIASKQCLWVIDKKSRVPWCIRWVEISHFGIVDGNCMKIDVFSGQGLHSYVFEMNSVQLAELYGLLSLQVHKMVGLNVYVSVSYFFNLTALLWVSNNRETVHLV